MSYHQARKRACGSCLCTDITPFTYTELYFFFLVFLFYLASVLTISEPFASVGGKKNFGLFLLRDFVAIVKLSSVCFYFFVE